MLAGGNNVPDRYSSDLWVHGAWAYTGTWGGAPRNGNVGNVVKIWSLGREPAPRRLADSIKVPGIGTVSDVQVSDDGTRAGVQRRARRRTRDSTSTTSPIRAHPAFLDSALVADRHPHRDHRGHRRPAVRLRRAEPE